MASLTFDEARTPAVHRLVSLFRALMFSHPRVGADLYALQLGASTSLVAGWNAVTRAPGADPKMVYIFVDPRGASGLHTTSAPNVPAEEIHHFSEADLPPLEQTGAWRQALGLLNVLENQRAPEVEQLRNYVPFIIAADAAPLRGADPLVESRIAQSLASVKGALHAHQFQLDTFVKPIASTIEDLLAFRLTGTQASNTLSVLLAHYALNIPSHTFGLGSVPLIKSQIEHLIALSHRLTDDRHEYDLGSFGTIGYLAMLWGDTAIVLSKVIAERAQGSELREWLLQRARFADEHLAHELAPSLHHPVIHAPFGVPEGMLVAGYKFLPSERPYANARGSVAEAAWSALQAYSATAKVMTSEHDALRGYFGKDLTEHLIQHVVACQIGSGMR